LQGSALEVNKESENASSNEPMVTVPNYVWEQQLGSLNLATASLMCVEGSIYEYTKNWDCSGGDIKHLPTIIIGTDGWVNDFKMCAEECDKTSACGGFNYMSLYRSSGRICYIKTMRRSPANGWNCGGSSNRWQFFTKIPGTCTSDAAPSIEVQGGACTEWNARGVDSRKYLLHTYTSGPEASDVGRCKAKLLEHAATELEVFAAEWRSGACWILRGVSTAGNGHPNYKCMLVHRSATAAPTLAPTSAPTPGKSGNVVKANGDPHLVNIYGEKFDLMQPGEHVMIHIPRRSAPSETLLHVLASVQRMGASCDDMYIAALNVTGQWAKHDRQCSFHSVDGGANAGKAKWLRFGKVDLKVAPGRTSTGKPYLNLLVRNLKNTGHDVGGLLGMDDHTREATRSSECKITMTL